MHCICNMASNVCCPTILGAQWLSLLESPRNCLHNASELHVGFVCTSGGRSPWIPNRHPLESRDAQTRKKIKDVADRSIERLLDV